MNALISAQTMRPIIALKLCLLQPDSYKIIVRFLMVTGLRITDYQRKLSYVADSVKGPKDEMRYKITVIKKMLDEVSALAEICGGRLTENELILSHVSGH